MKQEFKFPRAVYVTLGPYLLYKNLLIRTFIYSEINTFGLPKFSKKALHVILSSISLCKKWFI